ncbi:MAG: Mo-dependent nitrogenase C-terminal domain-containing protein [Pseudanabaenaceae cyanobacterium]
MQTYSQTQITAWLRGLMRVALADGEFSQTERELFTEVTTSYHPEQEIDYAQPISARELAEALGDDPKVKQDFLRMAVMMAMADGDYSTAEDEVIHEFCTALQQELKPMVELKLKLGTESEHHPDLLEPVKEWLDHMEIKDERLAKLICRVIPAQCPFERDITLFGKKIAHIPAMCKLNPLFDQLMGLRFRSLNFLAEKGVDVSNYCK